MLSRPVRWALGFFGLAAVAVAIALAGRHGSGYVVMVVPPWRIELSVMMFIALVFLAFLALYFLIRVGQKAWALPREIERRRIEAARNGARDKVFSSLQLLFSGRFKDAEGKAREAMGHDETRDLAAALAAWAAHEGGNTTAAVPYLDSIRGEHGAHMRDASKAYMLLADGRAPEALALLKSLAAEDPKNPGVLKMKVEAEMAEKAWDDVLATLEPLTRSGLLPEGAAQQLRLNAEINLVATRPAAREPILAAWRGMGSGSRFEPAMVAAVARRLMGIGEGAAAREVLEEAIERRGAGQWEPLLAGLYGDCVTDQTLAQIDHAEQWLRREPRDAVLLGALGKLCMRQSLWGKAQSYLEASVALQPTLDAHMTLARLMEQLGRRDEAVAHIRKSAELAGR
ncbi:MAG TPA: heme biosynthesis HemY N-terminal domain-containing protein [Usitatibacteraceae bacterium]|nr:heme biosynthesis HemY N-terminal domain-containing protein [Usitatibacteraceae bacterium]